MKKQLVTQEDAANIYLSVAKEELVEQWLGKYSLLKDDELLKKAQEFEQRTNLLCSQLEKLQRLGDKFSPFCTYFSSDLSAKYRRLKSIALRKHEKMTRNSRFSLAAFRLANSRGLEVPVCEDFMGGPIEESLIKQYRIDSAYQYGIDTSRNPHIRIAISSELRIRDKEAAKNFDDICSGQGLVKCYEHACRIYSPPVAIPPEYFELSTANHVEHFAKLKSLDEALKKAGWTCLQRG